MYRIFAIVALSTVAAWPAIGQTVTSASVRTDGKVSVLYSKHPLKEIPAEEGQVGCENVRIALDRRTVAWSVLIENCCTSYPVPVEIVVYRDSKKILISPGQMVWEWRFIGRGERIAVLSGPVHGWANSASLYASRTGKRLQSWDGNGASPAWARGWQTQFESQPHLTVD